MTRLYSLGIYRTSDYVSDNQSRVVHLGSQNISYVLHTLVAKYPGLKPDSKVLNIPAIGRKATDSR